MLTIFKIKGARKRIILEKLKFSENPRKYRHIFTLPLEE